MGKFGVFEFLTEGLLSEEQANELLKPYLPTLSKCWRQAWADWLSLPSEMRSRVNVNPTARANFVNALATSYAKELLPVFPETEICEDLQFFKFYVGDAAVLRMKRLDDDRLARNFSTEQQKLWYSHSHIQGIKDSATRLTVGYVLDAAEQDIREILVTLQLKNDLVYAIRVEDQPQIVTIPQSEPSVPAADVLPVSDRKNKKAR